VKVQCRTDQHIKTLSGRRRHIVGIRAADKAAKAKAERQAVNSIVQGSAADLIKNAMIAIDAELNPPTGAAHGGGAQRGRMLLQIHDELLFEVAEAHAPALRERVRRIMQAITTSEGQPLRVPLRVQIKQGLSWGELEAIE